MRAAQRARKPVYKDRLMQMKRQMHPCCACILFHERSTSCFFNCWVYCLLSWFSGSFWGCSGRRKGVVYTLQGQTPQTGLPCPALSIAGKLPECARRACVHVDPRARSRLASLQDSSGLSTTQSRVFFKCCKQLLYLQLMSSLI